MYPFLSGPWGNDDIKNATMENVIHAIKETSEWRDQYGFFLLSIDYENSLTTYADLTVVCNLYKITDDDKITENEIKVKVESWEIVMKIHSLFLDLKVDRVKDILRNAAKKDNQDFIWVAKIRHISEDEKEGFSLKARTISYWLTPTMENMYNEEIGARESILYLKVVFKYVGNMKEKLRVIKISWEEVKELYSLFLDSKFDRLREILRNRIDQETKPG